MVDQFDNCEFWLPSEFLTDGDDDICVDKKEGADAFSGFGSEMGSPVESVVSSNASESDEDDYITALTCKMPHSNLQHNSYAHQNNKAWGLSSSPNSPLCNSVGEFTKNKTGTKSARNELFVPVEQPGPNPSPQTQLAYQQLQAIRFEHLRRHQMMNQSRGVKNGERMPIGLPASAWPPLQRSQPGTGMTAVLLGNKLDVAKKQCAGTGVFLPRTEPSTGNRKNKPAYSPVLIPDKVIQALNLNLETLGVQTQPRLHPGYYNNYADYGAALNYININKNKKNHAMVQQSVAGPAPENQELLRLPAEWTY